MKMEKLVMSNMWPLGRLIGSLYIKERCVDPGQPHRSGRDPKSIPRDRMGISTEYSSTVDHMNCSKRMARETKPTDRPKK